MADYNVNMKQWNGTSFDNVLPLAYNAKQLEGQSLAEVKQWVQDNGLLLYTGQYFGNGTYGYNNRVKISFPFKPLLIILPPPILPSISTYITMENSIGYFSSGYGGNDQKVYVGIDGNTVFYYSEDDSSYQANMTNRLYSFAAIGGYDMGGATEWVITSSGSWTVPKTGRYMLELYGGGGGTARYKGSSGYTGGASCQHYDSISLTSGENINIVIGSRGSGNNAGGATSFGSYSVSGGGGTYGENAGAGAGNYGAAGVYRARDKRDNVYGTGVFSTTYGYGAGHREVDGGPGAVYLKYLGA